MALLTIEEKRSIVADWQNAQIEESTSNFKDLVTELFFLQHDGNFVEFSNFKRRPSKQFVDYLQQNPILHGGTKRKTSSDSGSSNKSKSVQEPQVVKIKGPEETPKSPPTNSQERTPVNSDQPRRFGFMTTPLSPASTLRLKRSSRNTLSDVYEDTIGSQEEILERAKQEAVVQRRVAELRKQGLWSQRRLPKVQEPPRNKTHWDYLLEEMRWLAADFAQERKWKRVAARKLVRMVSNYHKDQHEKEKRAEREEQQKLRRIASSIARQVKIFWSNIGKVVQYKQQCLLDEKRQKALDVHLNFIVDQTAKYSDWLTQGLNQGPTSPMSKTSSKHGSDDEFLPQGASTDDEETIAVEEEENTEENVSDELALLKQESELPFEDLLNQLPVDAVENIGKPLPHEEAATSEKDKNENQEDSNKDTETPAAQASETEGASSSDNDETSKPSPISLRRSARKRQSETDAEPTEAKKQKTMDVSEKEVDAEFSGDENSSDDEATVQEQEDQEKDVDHQKEIENLQAEGDMPIEELLKMYGGAADGDSPPASPGEELDEKEEDSNSDKSSSEDEVEEDKEEAEPEEEEIGMDYLLNKDYDKDKKPVAPTGENVESSPSKEITDVAAEAMTLQPTGHTLATTQVLTTIPHLLRHTLREYQHIGLDWLVTMYSKRLNGILADEMGLGKTIQTIALLAHLAVEKGVWGPHLIVVPTSVMLNWEMEFKKWCPGFKILTYYGSQKERKLKRTGWTKSNAFHVCITSYKLVIQDHPSFRRKKWRYLILDEAQNIKNFKSQRWQALLNFNSQRRLLLTGTPLQNNLMELWSLMHFLMPQVFQSHKEFKEWFSNPMTGMIEGAQEFNEKIVRRLHKVLRPFLLRRIKKDVEKQMPNKYEHVIRCHLSKRQRFLYEDFMSKASTKDTLAGGHFMSVINVLMQLRKVCNHPNLFEPRPTVSPFVILPIVANVPSIVHKVLEKHPFEEVNLCNLNLHLPTLSRLSTTEADSIKRLQTPRKLIEEIHSSTPPVDVPPDLPVTDQIKAMVQEKLYLAALQSQKSSPFNLQQGTHAKTSSNAQPTSAKIVTIPPKNDADATSRSNSTQSITLQYQTAQGTRWATIPNGQIRHLPGGVVQIVTSGVSSRSSTPISQVPVTTPQATTNTTTVAASSIASGMVESVKDSPVSKRKRLPEESYSRMVVRLRNERRDEVLQRIANINDLRCSAYPSYLPANTIRFLQTATKPRIDAKKPQPIENTSFKVIKKSPPERYKELKELLLRFTFVIPKVTTSTPQFNVSHPTPWRHHARVCAMDAMRGYLSKSLVPYHSSMQLTKVQFPEARLIQYDCGKLQVLSVLLRRFWVEKHRILIFTQMTRVLDILEAFLSYHGYRYLRLDGSTQIEQRMARMERFNNDPRIFCFILSTRSGGIGVNLTGADTVVFYDSDWNPTMDAQAQDRCHRIGQTRDVHIYRLISERTVEENILKKANQKRLLGNLAIEGGSFTTAFFKHQAIKDLFEEPSGLEDLAEAPQQRPLTARQKAIEAAKSENTAEAKSDDGENLEEALLESEDKEDANAAKLLKQEQDAVLEEFTEAEEKSDAEEEPESKFKLPKGSKYEEELKTIYDELNPIEKYALNYLELTAVEMNDLELQMAEDVVEQSKKDWQLQHLIMLKQEEEQRMEEDEDEIFYTREDAENQMYIDELSGEVMPIWLPPTPPQDDNDVYVDACMSLLYLPTPMTEDQLPPIAVKRERKRIKHETNLSGPRRKFSRIDINVPKSLFNHPLRLAKKKELKPHKLKQQKMLKQIPGLPGTPTKHTQAGMPVVLTTSPKENASELGSVGKASIENAANSEWIVNEDWALLQAVQQVLDMPLSLATLMPAHTPNWHLVADVVNAVGSIFRSPKQCKLRFESVIVQREEGKPTLTTIPEPATPKKKMKLSKLQSKTKLSRTQKTNILFTSDSNQQFTSLYSSRFEACKTICNKRNPPSKNSSGSGQFQRNPKHTNILHDSGITYDKPLLPTQVAAARAKKIASQKKPADQLSGVSQPAQSTIGASASVAMPQQVGNTLVVANGGQLVGKTSIQMSTPGLSQLTAFPCIVNSGLARSHQGQAAMTIPASSTKMHTSKASSASLTLRTISGNSAPQLQIRQPAGTPLPPMSITFAGGHAPMVTITTAIAGASATLTRPITYPPRGTSQVQKFTQQQIRQVAKQTTPVKQQMKQLRVTQQQPQQDITGTIVSGANTVFGKKLQVAKMTKAFTPQELELLMKQRSKTIPQRTSQVQIPIQAQVQAQHVRTLAAQQANEPITTSKPLPITVPVSSLALNLSEFNVTSTSQAKQMIVSGGQASLSAPPQLLLQQQFLKQHQQQQPRQVIATKQLVPAGTTTVRMTPQIQAHVLQHLVAQQSKQRRPKTQQPVTLTVTKLLQTPSTRPTNTALRHTLVPQGTQQISQMPITSSSSNIATSGIVQQQRLMPPQLQQIQATRGRQIHTIPTTQAQQMIVASAPVTMQRQSVVAISNQSPAMQVHPQILSQQVAMRNQTMTLQVNPSQANIQSLSTAPIQIVAGDTSSSSTVVTLPSSLESSMSGDPQSSLPK